MKSSILLSTVASFAIIGLVGCGGGGSAPSAGDETTKVNGIAVDDLILNGKVVVKDSHDNVLVEGRTKDTDGSYDLDINYSGVVVLNVSCDENSTMLNPETSVTMECPRDVLLRSMATLDGTEAPVNVNISPLTEVAYSRALAISGGDLTEEALEKARSQVALAFGVDPISTNPITNETYKAVIGAIHKVAEDEGTSVMDVTNDLSDAFADGVVESGESGIEDIVDALGSSGVTVPLAESGGSFELPDNPASLDDIAEAKAFAKELRTQVDSVKKFAEDEATKIDKAFNDMAINMEYIGTVADSIGELIGAIYENGITSIDDVHLSANRTISVTKTGAGAFSYTIEEDSKKWNGTVSFPESIVGDTAEDELYKTQNLKFVIKGELPVDKANKVDTQKVSLDIKITVKSGMGATIDIKGKIDTKGDVVEVKTASLELGYIKGEADEDGEVEPQFNYIKVNKIDLEGVAGGYTIDGKLDINSYVQNKYMKNDGGMIEEEHGSIHGVLECKSGVDINARSITFTYNGEDYAPNSTDIIDGKYHFRFDNVPANLEYGEWETHMTYDATCSDSSDIEFHNHGSWGYTHEKLNNSGWLPNKATFTGSIKSATDNLNGVLGLEWLNAKTINPDDDTQDAELKATLNGKLQMKDRPELSINLALDTKAKTFAADYTYGKTVINVTANETTNDKNQTVVTYHATNQVGDTLDIVDTDGDITGSLTKDGKELGSVEKRNKAPIIKYIDGSFESLF